MLVSVEYNMHITQNPAGSNIHEGSSPDGWY